MDWTKQAEDMLKTWTSSQQAMWDSWMKTMQGFGSNQPNDAWESPLRHGEIQSSVRSTRKSPGHSLGRTA